MARGHEQSTFHGKSTHVIEGHEVHGPDIEKKTGVGPHPIAGLEHKKSTTKPDGSDQPSTHSGQPLDELGVLDDAEAVRIYDIESDNSPYPEVRAVVSPTNDETLPVNTLRAWALGIIFTMLGSGANQFFSLRYPSVTISSLVAQLVSFPVGVGLAKALPVKTVDLGPLGRWCINPDHNFNAKEHSLITIMANISFTSAWATDVIQAQVAFYGQKAPAGYQVLMVLTCQMFGLGIAGLASDILVKPAAMIWPSTLANAALFQTLHLRENNLADGWKVSRLRYFLIVFAAAFIWYWFPGYIFTALSYFTWICWAAPNNVVVNQLFGQVSDCLFLGFSPFFSGHFPFQALALCLVTMPVQYR